MGNLIGGQKGPRATITEHDRAVLALKAQRKKLEDQSRLMERRIEANVAAARELVAAKKKERALLALKRKKLCEHQLASMQAYLLNVEDMLANMELTKQQANVTAALRQGNEALKKAQQEMPLDDIQKLMDDTAEAKEYQDKVQDLLSNQLDASDNEAVLQELEQLEDAALHEEVAQLPNVPQQQAQAQRPAEQQQAEQAATEAAVAAALAMELPTAPRTKVELAPAAAEEARQLEPALLAS